MSDSLDQDFALAVLVNVVNSTQGKESGPGVTLTVGGLMISGDLIPNWAWFDEVNDELVKATPRTSEEEAYGWGVLFTSYRDSIKQMKAEEEAALAAAENLAPRYQEALQGADTTAFIHLRDAKVYHPGQRPLPDNGMHWRGRLSEVSGWSFGKLT